MPDKILVFGKGQIASFIPTYMKNVVFADADIRKKEEIRREIIKYKPTVVINVAAMTSIDWCELNKVEAFEVNTLGASYIWKTCEEFKIFFVHFSSGCIYHSWTYDKIYKEGDKPNPRCYYSWTKVWADNLLGKDSNLLIIRPRVIISSQVSARNTLVKWLVYSHFIKDQNSVTIIEDMMPILDKMIKKRFSGTFNIVNKGTISPLEVAYMLKEKINPNMEIIETTLDEINKNLVAKRVTTILDTNAIRTLGCELPSIDDSLPGIIAILKHNLEEAGGLKALDKIREETMAKYTLKQNDPTTYIKKN